MTTERILYVGMDVDKEKIAVAVLNEHESTMVSERTISNTKEGVAKYFKKLKEMGPEIRTCYEAG